MILDREGEVAAAMVFYEKSYAKADPHTLIKAATNLTVCYEKMGLREKALKIFEELPELSDPKLNNNMGVILKRECLYDKAIDCYSQALTGSQEFFPLYNMAISLTA